MFKRPDFVQTALARHSLGSADDALRGRWRLRDGLATTRIARTVAAEGEGASCS